MDIGIIGSGLAGLSLAKEISPKHNVALYDKARGAGGRLASRRYNINGRDEYFDFGAQFFYAKTTRFKALLEAAKQKGAIARWDASFVEMQASTVLRHQDWDTDYPHYVGSPTMNSFAKYMADDLHINLRCHIKAITKSSNTNTWQLWDESQNLIAEHQWLILACPAQQAVSLLPTEISFRPEIEQNRQMVGCYSLMLAFENSIQLPFQCGLIKDADISWVSLEHSKPNRSSLHKLVIHATNQWAEENMHLELPAAQDYMLKHGSEILGLELNKNIFVDIHRWRYANIGRSKGGNFYAEEGANIAAIGDWCIQGRAESAFTSAVALAERYFL